MCQRTQTSVEDILVLLIRERVEENDQETRVSMIGQKLIIQYHHTLELAKIFPSSSS